MLMLFEVLMAVFMEKRTAKDNRNSSLPSSQTAKEDNSATQPGAKGKGKSQNGALSGNTRTVETVRIAPVNQCRSCGEDLRDTPCQGHERRTRIDILFEKVVSHVDAEIKQCPGCQSQTKGRFPADMPGPLQYGPGIKASIVHLLRELVFVSEANGYAWAANMKRLLQQTCANVAQRKRKQLTQNEYKHLQKRYRNILTRGGKEFPPIPPRQNGKRGRIAKSDAGSYHPP